MDDHRFWANQPVSLPDSSCEINEPVETDKNIDEISTNPVVLPPGFEWAILDITQKLILEEFAKFLKENYIEDESSMFKLQYSEKVLLWALTQSGYFPECIKCIRLKSTGKIVATVAATPAHIFVQGKKLHVVFVNFLCISKSLRSKRIAPVLIKEITRVSNLRGIFQALHTGAIKLPTSICAATYYHRFLNPKKLLDSGFSHLPKNIQPSLYYKIHKTPPTSTVPGFRLMQSSDVNQLTTLLNNVTHFLSKFQQKFKLSMLFTEELTRDMLLPKEGVIFSYVVENEGNITDFISFYCLTVDAALLPSNGHLNLAMLFYYANSTTPLSKLIDDLTFFAHKEKFDVINALEIMDTQSFITSSKFNQGSGVLKYYLFNWRCSSFSPNEIGVFLV